MINVSHDPDGIAAGDAVARVFAGEPPFYRSSSFEPSLLPHLARLCPAESLGEVLVAADVMEVAPLKWPQLRESVRNQLALRFADDAFVRDGHPMVTPVELAVRRCVARQEAPAAGLWPAIDGLADVELRLGLTGRLLACERTPSLERCAWLESRPGAQWWSDIESVRALLVALGRLERSPRLVYVAETWTRTGFDPFRAAHVLPALADPGDRRALALDILAVVAERPLPAWCLALFVSRVAPHLPPDADWHFGGLREDEAMWIPFLAHLRRAPIAPSLDADTRRAHPFARDLEAIRGPQRATAGLAAAIVDWHGGTRHEGARPSMTARRTRSARDESPPQRRTAPTPPPPRPPQEDPRWLNAAIGDPGAASRQRRKAFRAGAENEVVVVIDVLRPGWLGAPGTSREDSIDAKLPPGGYDLMVMFQIPSLGEAQTRSIRLPPTGPSEEAVFRFTAPAAGQRIEAMITVLHGNRALQAATLSGHCFADPTEVPPGFEVTMRFAVIRPGTTDLDDRTPFDAALVAGGGTAGPGAAGVVGGVAVAFEDEHLGPIAERVRNLLRDLADNAARYAGAVEDEEAASAERDAGAVEGEEAASARRYAGAVEDEDSVKLLRALAFQGCDLHRLIAEPLERARPGAKLDRIQVVVNTDAFVPLEFVYDFPPPRVDATLCPNWRTALQTGHCDPTNHPTDPAGSAATVCPAGFWALRKVIERHVVTTQDAAALGEKDFSIRAEVSAARPALDRLTPALVAWSERVDAVVPDQSAALVAALQQTTGAAPVEVATWADWLGAITTHAPPLLVLLSHTVTEQGTAALEIGPDGRGSRCPRVGLSSSYVKRDPAARPVVLLLGCDTAVPGEEPETFIDRFRDEGAAVVVGTVAPVLGENAVPVAIELIRTLAGTTDRADRAGRVTTIGEAMLEVRRALVAAGHLTALCLTAVGDADWQLAI